MTLESHNFVSILKFKNFDYRCVFVRTCSIYIISNKLNSETSQSVRFKFINNLFGNFTVVFVTIKLKKLLFYFRLLILLSSVFSWDKFINVFSIFFLLLENGFRKLIFIYQMVLWLLSWYQLDCQKSLIFFMIVPNKIIINWWNITVIKRGISFFISKFIFEKFNFSFPNMGFTNTYRSEKS